MAAETQSQQPGAAAETRDVEDFASVLKQSFKPKTERAATEVEAGIATLVNQALADSFKLDKPEGALVCKTFHGSGYAQQVKLFKDTFRVVKPIKPKASRDKSSETFLVGLGLKN